MNEEKPVRIGDREREEAVARLGAHYEAGRLTAEEHQERVGEALRSKTQLDLATLFEDLPGEPKAGPAGDGYAGAQQEEWAGPWGWARPPWTAPQDEAGAQASAGGGRAQDASQGQAAGWAARGGGQTQESAGGRAQYGSQRARGGRVPLPFLMVLAVVGVLLSVACVVLGGHPPVLPFVLIVAGVLIAKSRRLGWRA